MSSKIEEFRSSDKLIIVSSRIETSLVCDQPVLHTVYTFKVGDTVYEREIPHGPRYSALKQKCHEEYRSLAKEFLKKRRGKGEKQTDPGA